MYGGSAARQQVEERSALSSKSSSWARHSTAPNSPQEMRQTAERPSRGSAVRFILCTKQIPLRTLLFIGGCASWGILHSSRVLSGCLHPITVGRRRIFGRPPKERHLSKEDPGRRRRRTSPAFSVLTFARYWGAHSGQRTTQIGLPLQL